MSTHILPHNIEDLKHLLSLTSVNYPTRFDGASNTRHEFHDKSHVSSSSLWAIPAVTSRLHGIGGAVTGYYIDPLNKTKLFSTNDQVLSHFNGCSGFLQFDKPLNSDHVYIDFSQKISNFINDDNDGKSPNILNREDISGYPIFSIANPHLPIISRNEGELNPSWIFHKNAFSKIHEGKSSAQCTFYNRPILTKLHVNGKGPGSMDEGPNFYDGRGKESLNKLNTKLSKYNINGPHRIGIYIPGTSEHRGVYCIDPKSVESTLKSKIWSFKELTNSDPQDIHKMHYEFLY